MRKESDFVPIRKVIKIINSCETTKQLESCKSVITSYVRLIKKMNVINSELVRKRLLKEYNQKKFQLKMIKSFMVRQQKEYTQKLLPIS